MESTSLDLGYELFHVCAHKKYEHVGKIFHDITQSRQKNAPCIALISQLPFAISSTFAFGP